MELLCWSSQEMLGRLSFWRGEKVFLIHTALGITLYKKTDRQIEKKEKLIQGGAEQGMH